LRLVAACDEVTTFGRRGTYISRDMGVRVVPLKLCYDAKGGTAMTPKDWTLLVIAAANRRAVQPVHLQKALFLLGENLTPKDLGTSVFYHFQAYDYGPFDGAIYADAESLASEGLVIIDLDPCRRYREYRVTDKGQGRAEELRSGASSNAVQYLDKVVRWVQSISFNDLIEAIYKAYPHMAAKSVFRRLTEDTH